MNLALLIAAALVFVNANGCQNNNSQRDLVARDLRMQEDRIYAMEDYIDDYQQLICKYRSENAALKQQLGDSCSDVDSSRGRRATPSNAQDGERSMLTTPPTNTSPAPKNGGSQSQPLEMPDVPPLQGINPNGAGLELPPSYITDSPDPGDQSSDVLPSSYSQPIDTDTVLETPVENPAETSAPLSESPSSQDANEVFLRGEVVANPNGGGPRLAIQVEPRDAAGNAHLFNGNVSLMLLAIQSDGAKQNLGRWDFGPDDAQVTGDPLNGIPMLKFHIELPADTLLTNANELWARLMPLSGGKLLAKAHVDLTQPGEFASQMEQADTGNVTVAKSVETNGPDPASVAAVTTMDGGWSTARPGEPAVLPAQSDKADSGWRASSVSLPEPVAKSATVPPLRRSKWPNRIVKTAPAESTPATSTPAWSPDRQAASNDAADGNAKLVRPRWSAKR